MRGGEDEEMIKKTGRSEQHTQPSRLRVLSSLSLGRD